MSGHPDDPIDWALVQRYCTGECTPAERVRLDQWVDGQPERRAYIASLRALADASARRKPHLDVESAWQRLSAQYGIAEHGASGRGIAHLISATDVARPRSVLGPRADGWATRSRAALAAAGVVCILIAGLFVVPRFRLGSTRAREYVTVRGERATVVLADGTHLTLAPNSQLQVPSTYGRRERNVSLEGEAYFDVRHDIRHPFTVHARGVVVRDLGTRFVVRAYTDDANTRVAVAEGRVVVGASAADSLLARGDVARVASAGAIAVTHGADLAPDLAWVQGRLAFDDAPLPQVAADLARAYDVEIHLADSALTREAVTGTFTDEPVDEVLEVVTRSVGAEYVRSGRTVVIRRRPGAVRRSGAESEPLRVTTSAHRINSQQ